MAVDPFANQYLTLDATMGRETMKTAIQSSTGNASANQIVATGTDGRLDVTLMPKAVLSNNITTMVAAEALTIGRYVNIFSNAGVPNCRLADATNDRPAHGFVRNAYASGDMAQIYMEGGNDLLSNLIPGTRQFLSTAGQATATVPVKANAQIFQLLGYATTTSEIDTDIEDSIVL